MKTLFFRYKTHPGDLFRNTDIVELPNPDNDLEGFLIWFLNTYQTDDRIAYINDLSKLLHDEFSSEVDRDNFINEIGAKTNKEIQEEINLVEDELKIEAYENFYQLLLSNEIEIINEE